RRPIANTSVRGREGALRCPRLQPSRFGPIPLRRQKERVVHPLTAATAPLGMTRSRAGGEGPGVPSVQTAPSPMCRGCGTAPKLATPCNALALLCQDATTAWVAQIPLALERKKCKSAPARRAAREEMEREITEHSLKIIAGRPFWAVGPESIHRAE